MADAILAELSLPETVNLGEDVEWIDEFEHSPVPQQVRKTLDGGIVVETISPNDTNQKVTVKCGWFNRTTLNQLLNIRDRTTQSTMTLTLCDGRVLNVLLAYHLGPPVIVTPHLIVPEYSDAEARYEEWYDISLVFIKVA